jgi:hypothetical protein
VLAPALVIAPPAVVLLADASSSGGLDPYAGLIGTLVTPVIVVLLLLAGKLHTDSDYQSRVDYGKDEHEERVRLQAVIDEQVIPRMGRNTLILEALMPLVRDQVRLRAMQDTTDGAGGGG